ncbi:MAG TPA: helix-turn-helix domain-containing protein [Acidimicrobiales bacterium]
MAYDANVRARAVELRDQGLSYREIRLQLGVAKSTLSQWLSGVALTDDHRAAMVQRARGVSATRADANRALGARRRAAIRVAARDEVPPIGASELFVAGVVAYWAEGSKTKPWGRAQLVQFANSDAGLISLFLAWLRLIEIGPERLVFRVMIHESADVGRALEFWSGVLGVPASAVAVTLKRHNAKTVRKNTDDGYHGCLSVTVRRSSELNLRIAGWCEGLVSRAVGEPPAGTLVDESGVV